MFALIRVLNPRVFEVHLCVAVSTPLKSVRREKDISMNTYEFASTNHEGLFKLILTPHLGSTPRTAVDTMDQRVTMGHGNGD